MEKELSDKQDESSFCGTSNSTIESLTLLELFNLAMQGDKEAEALLDVRLSVLLDKETK